MWLILKWYTILDGFFLLDSVRYRDDVMTTLKVWLVQYRDPDVRLISQIDIVMCFIYNISARSWRYRRRCHSDIVTISECPLRFFPRRSNAVYTDYILFNISIWLCNYKLSCTLSCRLSYISLTPWKVLYSMFVLEVKIKHSFICDVTTRPNSHVILWMEALLLICHVTSLDHVIKGSCILWVIRFKLYSY